MKILCLLRTIKYTIKNFGGLIRFGAITEGHEYIETFNGVRNGRIEQDLVCEICGHKVTGWK